MECERCMKRVLCSFWLCCILPIWGQNRIKIEVGEPVVQKRKSPDFQGGGSQKWDRQEWLELEVELEVLLTDAKRVRILDELVVKWFVACLDPRLPGKEWVLLQRTVTHVNIPVGEKVYCSVYCSPTGQLRLTGQRHASTRTMARVGGEVWYKGEIVGYFSSKKKRGWWKSGELSQYNKVQLLRKDETPFQYLWWDRYAETKVIRY